MNDVERLVKEHPEAARSLAAKVGPTAEEYLNRTLEKVGHAAHGENENA